MITKKTHCFTTNMASLFSRITGLSSFPIQVLLHVQGPKGRTTTIRNCVVRESNPPITPSSHWQGPQMPANCNLSSCTVSLTPASASSSSGCHIVHHQLSGQYSQIAFTCREYFCLYLSYQFLTWWRKCPFCTLSKLLKVLYIVVNVCFLTEVGFCRNSSLIRQLL